MSSPSPEALWQEALARLLRQEHVSPGFEAHLYGARPLQWKNATLVVEFPDAFTRDWVQSRYAPALQACLEAVGQRPCSLRLVTPDDHATPATNGEATHPSTPPTAFSGLNPRYTFESFVVGPSNRFAYSACRGVLSNPAGPYNPLFLYGGVGLGKTHLMQAVAHEFLRASQARQVLYVTTESFTNDLVDSLARRSMPEFRARYRSVDVLLLDDVHFAAGKESTQEEFFHTFNALYEAGRQIILSSDRPPTEIPKLEERLRSRFAWGLLADIQPPDYETRLAILRQHAKTVPLEVPDPVLQYIAEQVVSNIRVLEGALKRVLSAAALQHAIPSLELARLELQTMLSRQKSPITVERVLETVAEHFGLRAADLRGKSRTREIAFARQIAMSLARELTQASLPFIGQQFGGRDHSTVLHALEKVKAAAQSDPRLGETLRHLRDRLTRPAS